MNSLPQFIGHIIYRVLSFAFSKNLLHQKLRSVPIADSFSIDISKTYMF